MTETRIQSFLPLKTQWFHILLSLAGEEQHGYGIMQEVLERTTGKVRLWPATLYGSIKRLIEAGLIEESTDRPAPELDDARRRYYRLSPLWGFALPLMGIAYAAFTLDSAIQYWRGKGGMWKGRAQAMAER